MYCADSSKILLIPEFFWMFGHHHGQKVFWEVLAQQLLSSLPILDAQLHKNEQNKWKNLPFLDCCWLLGGGQSTEQPPRTSLPTEHKARRIAEGEREPRGNDPPLQREVKQLFCKPFSFSQFISTQMPRPRCQWGQFSKEGLIALSEALESLCWCYAVTLPWGSLKRRWTLGPWRLGSDLLKKLSWPFSERPDSAVSSPCN